MRVTFTLNGSNAVFPGTTANQLQLTGLRMSATIVGGGYPAWPSATIKIYGMALKDMNALAVQVVEFGKTGYLPNSVLVEANGGDGWAAAYAGNILTAATDYSAQPDVPLVVTSMWGVYDSVAPATITNFPSSAAVADVLSVIIGKMGQAFINNGVTGSTGGAVYYSGSLTDQLRAVCAAYNLDPTPNGTNTGITVSPKGQPDSDAPIILTPQTGLVANPVPQANGRLTARALYNPAYHVKSSVTIQGSTSVIDNNGVPTSLNSTANGEWFVSSVTNTIEALTPNGAWFSDLLLSPPSLAVATGAQ